MPSNDRDRHADSEWNSGWIDAEVDTDHDDRISAIEWIVYGLLAALLTAVIARMLKGIV